MLAESLDPTPSSKLEDLLNNEQKKEVEGFKKLLEEFIQDSDINAHIKISQYFFQHRLLPFYISETLGRILEDHKNTVAGFELEYIRYQGKGLFDAKAAFSCYKRAAKQEDRRAQTLLAKCYSDGIGTAEDSNKAMEWWEKAAKQGYARAQRNLANAYIQKGDFSHARSWYIKALAQGHGYAHAEVGSLLEEGKLIALSPVTPTFFYRMANDMDIADGAYGLARCYERGKGVEQDLARAVKLYRKAAHRGHIPAQYELGLFYKTGQGDIEKNIIQALKWFRRSAKQGYAPAQYMLGIIYDRGEGVAPDPEKAKNWYEKAVKQGDIGACCQLGVFLLKKDPERALELLKKAAKQGDVVAQTNLEIYFEKGIQVGKKSSEQIVHGYHLTQTAARAAPLTSQTPITSARAANKKTQIFSSFSRRR